MTHRWSSSALHGRWFSSADEALFDALGAGQAVREPGRNEKIKLLPFASIEERERSFGARH
jgi:hypothetical protein